MQFEHKYIFYFFALILIIAFILYLTKRWRKKTMELYGDILVVEKLFPAISKTKRIWKNILYTTAFTLMLIGLLNPQIGTKLEEVKRKGADIMICLDVSNSMNAEDISPTRLEKAKQALSKLIEKLKGDRIGVIVFGGQAYVQLPITTDYAAAKLFLGSINTGMIQSQGTAIGNAIDLAIESFGKDEGKNKAIVVITDGENHEDDAKSAAEQALEKGITVHTIGMGSEQGSPIPVYKNKIREGYRKDKEGNTIITKLNESMLQEIAAAGNGVYVRATNADVGLRNILDAIDSLEKKEFEGKMYSDYEDQFQWFIAGALVLLLIETFLTERKSKLYERLNLFGAKK